MRRYSYQPLTTSYSLTDLTDKSTLKTKARSLDNLYQTGITSQPIILNRFNPSRNINYTIDRHSTDEDDDNESVLHTRL